MKRNPIIVVCLSILSLLVNELAAQPGSLDIMFNPGSGANSTVYCMVLQTNGQIIAGGAFTSFNGTTQKRIVRLDTNGSVDSSFDPGVGPNATLNSLTLQTDGHIIIGGDFTAVNSLDWNHVARLRSDGSLDGSFNPGTGPSGGWVYAVAAQQDGRVLVGGAFSTFNGTNCNSLARLNSNGSVDPTFNSTNLPSGLYLNSVHALALQGDGKILVGLYFGQPNDSTGTSNRLVRLNSDGTVDTNFTAYVSGDWQSPSLPGVRSIFIEPAGKIVIGGRFTSVNGYSRQAIARLNPDGSVDTTFRPGQGANGEIYAVAVQADEKILVAGEFTAIDGTTRNRIARLNADGTVDAEFAPGIGAWGGVVNCVAIQQDGKAVIAGGFDSFNNTNINRIARLNSDTSSTTLDLLNPQIYFGTYLHGTVSNTYRIEWTPNFNTPSLWTPLFNVTLQTNPQFILDPNPASGQRFYRAVALP